MIKPLLAAIPLLLLVGCFPYVKSYVHLEAPGAKYEREVCNQFGPYVALDFEQRGVQVRVNLEPGNFQRSKIAFLRLRAPRDVVISIPSPEALVLVRDGKEPIRIKLALTNPPSERINKFAPLRRDDGMTESVFEFVDLPFLSERGSLTLPVIMADGALLTLSIITFLRRPFAGMLPLNC